MKGVEINNKMTFVCLRDLIILELIINNKRKLILIKTDFKILDVNEITVIYCYCYILKLMVPSR